VFKSMVTRIIMAVGFMVLLLVVLFADDVWMRLHGSNAQHTAGWIELAAGIVIIGGLVLLWVAIAPTHVLKMLALLTKTANDIREKLPSVIGRLQQQQRVKGATLIPYEKVSPDQFGQVHTAIIELGQRAVDEMVTAYFARQDAHHQADAAARQARTADIVIGLARRYQSLMRSLLGKSLEIQRRVEDPELLAELYLLDNDLVQALRLADHALILGGERVGEVFNKPASIIDVCRAAVQEVSGKLGERYERVSIAVATPAKGARLHGHAVTNTVHLLAALMDNGLRYSPPGSPVEITAGIVARGLSIAVKDRGVGLTPALFDEWNAYIRSFSSDILTVDTNRLGLAVVVRLAQRHGIEVTLTATRAYGGVTAVVVIPNSLLDGIPDWQLMPRIKAEGLEITGRQPWNFVPTRPGGDGAA
jgi:signal transduction histidine kinase